MIKRSRRSLVSNPITCWSVMRSVSTPRGMQRPQPKKTAGTFRPLEHGLQWLVEAAEHHRLSQTTQTAWERSRNIVRRPKVRDQAVSSEVGDHENSTGI